MLPGETINSGASPVCPDCNKHLEFRVLKSGGGWYIGTACCCGPYSRESGYYDSEESAQSALKNNTYERRY